MTDASQPAALFVPLPVDAALHLGPIAARRRLVTVLRLPASPARIPTAITRLDFSDSGSQRTLAAAADAVAYELGVAAGREYFDELLAHHRSPV